MTSEEFISQLAAKLQAIGTLHGIGETWFSIDGTVPAGGVPFCGQIVTRAMYQDLFDWATAQGKVKTETEWQAHAAANGGNCPYYSSGDGSTTFRMPCVVAYLKGATSASNAGQYEAQKLPNLKGRFDGNVDDDDSSPANRKSGVFYTTGITASGANGVAEDNGGLIGFDASRYDPIYQDGADVTPETYTVLVGVYAFSIATNVGGTDVGNVASAVAALETEVNALNNKPVLNANAYLVYSWHDEKGNWIRKYSDGWIEQGGRFQISSDTKIVFNTPFTTLNYVFLRTSYGQNSSANNAHAYQGRGRYKTDENELDGVYVRGGGNCLGADWIAYGY